MMSGKSSKELFLSFLSEGKGDESSETKVCDALSDAKANLFDALEELDDSIMPSCLSWI